MIKIVSNGVLAVTSLENCIGPGSGDYVLIFQIRSLRFVQNTNLLVSVVIQAHAKLDIHRRDERSFLFLSTCK